MPSYTLPTIHLNGTGAKSLADEYEAFYEALDAATKALQSATCNARDFYPQGDAAWQQARQEREEAFRKLKDLQSYAEAWFNRASGLD
jgi:flagellar biosynthesis chaperone FliJ